MIADDLVECLCKMIVAALMTFAPFYVVFLVKIREKTR